MGKIDKLIQQYCPDGVEYVPLIELGSFYSGLTGKTKEDFRDGNAKFITYVNIFNNPSLKTDVEEKVKIADGEKQNTIQYGDLLFTGSSETPNECGMCSVLTFHTDEKLYLNSFCFGFRFNDLSDKCPSFMKYLFRSAEIRKKICKTANGVTRYNISKKEFGKIEIPLPPLPIQEEIARILDTFSELQAELQSELQEELETRKKQIEYYKNSMFDFKSPCIITTMDAICDFVSVGIATSATHAYTDTGIPMFRNQNIKENRLDDSDLLYISEEFEQSFSNKRLKENDILVIRTGYPGIACVVPKKYEGSQTFTTLIARLLPSPNILPKYICYYINSQKGKKYVEAKKTGAAQQNFGAKELAKMPIEIPSVLEQEKIIYILENIEAIATNYYDSLSSEIEARKQQYEFYRDKLLTFNRKYS